MRDFFLAPLLTLFSIGFYRRILRVSLKRGFLYLFYLSFVLSLCMTASVRLHFLPSANQFVSWLGKNLPELAYTREGIRMKITEPLLLSHPEWGPVIYFDPAGDFPKPEDLEKAFVIVTRTKVAYRDPAGGETRIQDLVPKEGGESKWQDFVVTGDRVLNFWFRMQPFFTLIFFVVFFFAGVLWKLIAGLVYSLGGLVLNLFRRERLGYASILKITFFALTPVTLLQCLASLFPAWRLPLNLLVTGLVTGLYLALGILATQPPRTPQTT